MMDIDVFSETKPSGQYFNSRYSLHALQLMQHSHYDDPDALARVATARAPEVHGIMNHFCTPLGTTCFHVTVRCWRRNQLGENEKDKR